MLSNSACNGVLSIILLFLTVLAPTVAGSVFEKLDTPPKGWTSVGKAQDAQPIHLQIALQQQNVAAFEQSVINMSTPGHPAYGNHFQSYEDVKSMLLPTNSTVQSVVEWLRSFNISGYKVDADWINFHTTVGQANSLLSTNFQWFANDPNNSVRILRALEYSVPRSVGGHIRTIQPITRFGQRRPGHGVFHHSTVPVNESVRSAALALNQCNSVMTPRCLKDLYKTSTYNASASSGSNIGISSFLQQYARYADLKLFEQRLAPYAKGQNFSVVSINGGLNDQNSFSGSGEANLDVQYAISLTYPLPVTEFSTGGLGPLVPDLSEPRADTNEPYLPFLHGILKLPTVPHVISISYGEDEQSVPEPYAHTVCNLFAQLTSRGVSILIASGDSGVGSGCEANYGPNRTQFMPQFPAACPWVTSVGATQFTHPEYAASFSGGGFSNYWARPSWQQKAVTTYLATLGDKFHGLYNSSGRGFPDVAAQGVSFAIYDRGGLTYVSGTSCATPTFSSIVALLNDVRLSAGLPSMGFLNPWLYSVGQMGLNDIVHGGSTGCTGVVGRRVPYASWNATKGWDPVTGLGTPDFLALSKLVLT